MSITPEQLIQQLSTIVDPALARLAVESYVDLQRRFLAGDWSPAELDGGRLCEAVSRCLLQADTGVVSHKDSPGDVRKVLLDDTRAHVLGQKDRQHLCKVVEIVYKFRSDRGAVHISPTYSANYMDSMLVLHAAKWIMAEFLRLVWKQDRAVVADAIAQLVQLEHSLIHELDGKPLVLAKNISAPEEVLLLLFNAAGNRLSRSALRDFAATQKPQTVNAAISRLIREKDVRPAGDGEVALTPSGQSRVIAGILPKMASR